MLSSETGSHDKTAVVASSRLTLVKFLGASKGTIKTNKINYGEMDFLCTIIIICKKTKKILKFTNKNNS